MLCDILGQTKWYSSEWLERQKPTIKDVQKIELITEDKFKIKSPGEQSEYLDKLEASADVEIENGNNLVSYGNLLRSCDGKEAIRVMKFGISPDRYNEAKSLIVISQKFDISPEFADATLEKLATPDTVVKSKEWFKLTHNPMWIEWRHNKYEMRAMKIGAILSKPEADSETIHCFFFLGGEGIYDVQQASFNPSSLRLEGGKLTVDCRYDEKLPEIPLALESLVLVAMDFIIRINSPRITETRTCDDQVAINKKRAKNGKQPLFSYVVVDLNKQVKEELKLAKTGSGEGGTRFHWRRGHFKLLSGSRYKEPGLHWWNPHTAGRKVHGEIKKDYVA